MRRNYSKFSWKNWLFFFLLLLVKDSWGCWWQCWQIQYTYYYSFISLLFSHFLFHILVWLWPYYIVNASLVRWYVYVWTFIRLSSKVYIYTRQLRVSFRFFSLKYFILSWTLQTFFHCYFSFNFQSFSN